MTAVSAVDVVELVGQRDRARRVAVALEQEHAALVKAVRTARRHITSRARRFPDQPGSDSRGAGFRSGAVTALVLLDTALLDAVGRTITTVGQQLADRPEDERPAQVIVLIITDGEENSSCEYTFDHVDDLITHQQEKYGWTFVVLGADQDAFQVGARLGIPAATTLSYASNHTEGTMHSLADMTSRGAATGEYRFTDGERDGVSP